MEVGTITGGRDSVQWWPGWPNRFFGASGPEIDILHEGSLFNRYKTAWLCRGCRRMVMEIPEEEIPKPLTSEKAAEQLDFSDPFNITAETQAVVLNFYISDFGYVLV